MAGEIFRSIIEELQPLDVENSKYIMRDNFTGKIYWILSFISFDF